MTADDMGLSITHIGFKYLSTPLHTFNLDNVLCVPSIKKNLISISQFCKTNNTIEFLPTSFYCERSLHGQCFCTIRLRMTCMIGQHLTHLFCHLFPMSRLPMPIFRHIVCNLNSSYPVFYIFIVILFSTIKSQVTIFYFHP